MAQRNIKITEEWKICKKQKENWDDYCVKNKEK